MWTTFKTDSPLVRIFIRPRFLLVLLMIVLTASLLIIWFKEPEMLKAQVTFKGCQRDIMFPKAWTVQRLRYLILREFYFQMQDRIPPACLTIMLKRNDTDKNGVHLPIDEELLKNVKIIAKLASTPQEMAKCIYRKATPQQPDKPHPIAKGAYRFWSLVYGGKNFLQRKPDTGQVTCGGSFDDNSYNTVMTTVFYGSYQFQFFFGDSALGQSSKKYFLTVENRTKVMAKEISDSKIPDSTLFMPGYYWAFTFLQSMQNHTHLEPLYLGCNGKNEAVMLPMNTIYPDPRILFITYEFT